MRCAFSAIFHRNAWPIRSQRPLAWSRRAICACCSPHRAANRLVQSTFLIGFAMRKVLSITQAPDVTHCPLYRYAHMLKFSDYSGAQA